MNNNISIIRSYVDVKTQIIGQCWEGATYWRLCRKKKLFLYTVTNQDADEVNNRGFLRCTMRPNFLKHSLQFISINFPTLNKWYWKNHEKAYRCEDVSVAKRTQNTVWLPLRKGMHSLGQQNAIAEIKK